MRSISRQLQHYRTPTTTDQGHQLFFQIFEKLFPGKEKKKGQKSQKKSQSFILYSCDRFNFRYSARRKFIYEAHVWQKADLTQSQNPFLAKNLKCSAIQYLLSTLSCFLQPLRLLLSVQTLSDSAIKYSGNEASILSPGKISPKLQRRKTGLFLPIYNIQPNTSALPPRPEEVWHPVPAGGPQDPRAGSAQYLVPATAPSFFPRGSSSSTPHHSPLAKSVSPTQRTTPVFVPPTCQR